MRDPFEQVSVRGRKAVTLTIAGALLLFAYALVFPTQVAVVGVVLTLPLIIMLHEAAHFVAAKRSGMKVTEFFVGFGPRIWSFRRGETEYGVKAVILGGYCRIIGMTNLEEVAPEDEERAYRSKGYLARVVVAGAGPAVHFVIAFVLMFALLFVAGDLQHERELTKLDAVSLGAAQAGIKVGDTLVAIDGKRITDWNQVAGVIQKHHAGDHVLMTVQRGTTRVTARCDTRPARVRRSERGRRGYHCDGGRAASLVRELAHDGARPGGHGRAPGGRRARSDLLAVRHVEVRPCALRLRQEQGRQRAAFSLAGRLRASRRARRERRVGRGCRSAPRDQRVPRAGEPRTAPAVRRRAHRGSRPPSRSRRS